MRRPFRKPRIEYGTKDIRCLGCNRVLDQSCFARDCTGRSTSWCNTCRSEYAREWKIDEADLEMVYQVWISEENMKSEARLLARSLLERGEITLEDHTLINQQIDGLRWLDKALIVRRVFEFTEEQRRRFYSHLSIPEDRIPVHRQIMDPRKEREVAKW